MTVGTLLNIVIAIGTVIISVASSVFVAGTRWGAVQSQLADLERDKVTAADLHGVTERLAKIEGMFTLRLKDGSGGS